MLRLEFENEIHKTSLYDNTTGRHITDLSRDSKTYGLVCWVLWHINLCRLFNAKSIFM